MQALSKNFSSWLKFCFLSVFNQRIMKSLGGMRPIKTSDIKLNCLFCNVDGNNPGNWNLNEKPV